MVKKINLRNSVTGKIRLLRIRIMKSCNMNEELSFVHILSICSKIYWPELFSWICWHLYILIFWVTPTQNKIWNISISSFPKVLCSSCSQFLIQLVFYFPHPYSISILDRNYMILLRKQNFNFACILITCELNNIVFTFIFLN